MTFFIVLVAPVNVMRMAVANPTRVFYVGIQIDPV